MEEFARILAKNAVYVAIMRQARRGKARQSDIKRLAKAMGTESARVVSAQVTDGMTVEELVAILTPILKLDHDSMTELAASLVTQMYRGENLGLNSVRPDFDPSTVRDVAETILEKSANGSLDSIKNDLTTYTWRQGDATMNRALQDARNVGLQVTVTRTYDGVGLHDGKDGCQWCLDRAGTWSYEEASAEGFVFARHAGCECDISINIERR